MAFAIKTSEWRQEGGNEVSDTWGGGEIFRYGIGETIKIIFYSSIGTDFSGMHT